jgi:hypothetical protein
MILFPSLGSASRGFHFPAPLALQVLFALLPPLIYFHFWLPFLSFSSADLIRYRLTVCQLRRCCRPLGRPLPFPFDEACHFIQMTDVVTQLHALSPDRPPAPDG